MFVFETGQANHPKWIINFPTKRHWRSKSRIEDIELGLTALAKDIEELGIQSIAIPPLGCGLGGLDWLDVRAFIEQELSALEDVEVVVFEPGGIAVARDRLDKDVASN
jgi:O-acetyl-ADP-ribose deacetylase (regulator of RNase III)